MKVATVLACGAAAVAIATTIATARGPVAAAGERDLAATARRLEGEAQRGSAHAAFLLGNAYRAGAGVPRDDAKALALYERAAQAEHPAALQTLALAYRYGELGLAADEGEARRYQMEAEHAARESPPPR